MRRIIPIADTVNRVNVTLDGVPVTAVEGESVAGLLMTMGVRRFHLAPDATPRGPYCGMGTCFGCLVEITQPDQPQLTLRACVTPVAEGMGITTAQPEIGAGHSR